MTLSIERNILTILLIAVVLCACQPLIAQEANAQNPYSAATRTLAVNRALLARCRAELSELKPSGRSPESFRRENEKLNIKMKALSEDRERLMASLPEEERAFEAAKDILSEKVPVKLPEKKQTPSRASSSAQPLPADKQRIIQMHEKGLQLVADQRYPEAAKIYEEIAIKSPDDDEAYLIMGHIYLLMGRYEKAETAFQNAVHIDGDNIHEIVPFYENMILQNPEDDMAYSNLGYAYLILGQYLKAKQAFQEALSINPENIDAHKGLKIIEIQ